MERKTLLQRLEEITSPAVARFIIYYYTDESKRKPFDEWKKCHSKISVRTYEECEEWLNRDDAQKAVQAYHKFMKIANLTKLYEKMYEKALSGDTQAGRWVMDFMKSEYFDESTDEIDEFLQGVHIPALKGGDSK